MIDTIVDIYHQNTVDLNAAKAAGIVGVIHKATEGASVQDMEYAARHAQAKVLGLLWGAYHYSSGASVSDQVTNFLQHAQPQEDDLVALDWESSSSGPDMTLEQARRFAEMIKAELGRWPVIYGGRLLRETIGATRDSVLANCPLWYSRYANAPIGIPTNTWASYTLWQYTDGNSGPEPHTVSGIGRCDRSRFQGSVDELKQQWPFARDEDGISPGPGLKVMMSAVGDAPPVLLAPTRRQKRGRRTGLQKRPR
jgi:lysozyme